MQNQTGTTHQEPVIEISEPMDIARKKWLAALLVAIDDDSEEANLEVTNAEQAVFNCPIACVGDALAKLSTVTKTPDVFVSEDDRTAVAEAFNMIDAEIRSGRIGSALLDDAV